MSNIYDKDQRLFSVNARSVPKSNTLYGSSVVSNEQEPLPLCLDALKYKQEYPHFRERMWVNKLVHKSRICFGTWNIETLKSKSMEIVDTTIRRRINFVRLQETKWVQEKAKELYTSGFKLWYTTKAKSKNGVDIIVDKFWTND